ncbi:MAG: hypothetical protein H6738_11650 [Alphaproteobacteria bacterium]|nr:hypothetical protein [Alphaproteobacteria bacterium]MCB9697426.1 hypothetical protein [Alphaproteobacteria bacterium]
MRTLVLSVLLAGCGGNQLRCDRMITAICDHEIECNRESDRLACEDSMHARWECEPDATPEQFQACEDEVGSTICEVAYPDSCTTVLCAAGHCEPASVPGLTEESGVYTY